MTNQEIILRQLTIGPQSLGQLVAYSPLPTPGPKDVSAEVFVVNALDFLVMSGKVVAAKASEMKQHYVFGNIGPKRDLADSIDARGLKAYKLAL